MATEQTVFSYSLNLSVPTDIQILVSGKHSYANVSGAKPWRLAIYFDGTMINYAGGAGAYTDSPQVLAFYTQAPVGSHTILITWMGHSTMQFRGVNAIIQGLQR